MRKWVQRLIYQKWFYGFLMLVLWIDSWTDVAEFSERHSLRELLSLALSVSGALLVTVIFVDLHRRWPPETAKGVDGDHTLGG